MFALWLGAHGLNPLLPLESVVSHFPPEYPKGLFWRSGKLSRRSGKLSRAGLWHYWDTEVEEKIVPQVDIEVQHYMKVYMRTTQGIDTTCL